MMRDLILDVVLKGVMEQTTLKNRLGKVLLVNASQSLLKNFLSFTQTSIYD